jgi:hypothetical protein
MVWPFTVNHITPPSPQAIFKIPYDPTQLLPDGTKKQTINSLFRKLTARFCDKRTNMILQKENTTQ